MLNLLFAGSRRTYRRLLYPLISSAIALGLIVGTPGPGQAIPWFDLIFQGVQIIQLSKVSDREEVSIGKQINQSLVGRQFRVYRGQAVNDYVNQVGQRIAAKSERPRLPYTFQVVDDDRVNAFATMGGYVYVTTGLLRLAENEAQLASVLGHETAHIEAKHLLSQMRQTAIARGVATAAGLDRSTMVALGVELALNRPNSRQDEYDADKRGLRMLSQSGYAPSAMVAFMEKLLKERSVPTFLSTHPATSDRIKALNEQLNTISANPTSATTGDGLDKVAYRAKIQPLLSSR